MSAPACHIDRLRLWRFRNYAEEVVDFGPGVTVVAGSNAQGKTNLLEAVATVALTRSPRAPVTADLISWGATEAQLQARLQRPVGTTEVSVRFRRDDGGQAIRTISVDGVPRHARALLGLCPVVIFWPEDLLLVRGGPEARRRLLDVVLSQTDPRTATDLIRYRRVLDQRNALLRQVRLGSASAAPLGGFTVELATYGGRVRVARTRLLAALEPLAAAALAELSGGRERLTVDYVADGDVAAAAEGVETASARLGAELNRRTAEELARGVTAAGPHRDDVEIALDGRAARGFASQGQKRSIVLACKLAEVRHLAAVAGVAPVLILDDVLSELDPDRRGQLLRALGAGSVSQTLLSTTETDGLSGIDLGAVRRLEVHRGTVREASSQG